MQIVSPDAAFGKKLPAIMLRELLHPVGHGAVIYAVLYTAQRRFGRHTLLQHTHFAEFIEVDPAELYYIGASGMPGDPAEYHQHDDVCESMTDVSFVSPAKIGHR